MRVKMLKDAPGSLDGATVGHYSKGREYDVTDDLGEAFVKEHLAEKVKDVPHKHETRVVDVNPDDPRRGGYGVTDPGSAENQRLARLEEERRIKDADDEQSKPATRSTSRKRR